MRKVTIELTEEAYVAAMAVSEIKGTTIDEYFEERVRDDDLVNLIRSCNNG